MINMLRCTLALILSGFFMSAHAQCSDCVIDQTCSSPDGFPTVCPATLPDAVVGTFYEQFLTFFMPATITDPGSGTVVDLISIEVTSISGLPFGTTYTLGDADGIFYPGQGQNLGCATICGTPLLPGIFDMLITVDATVAVSGFQFVQAQSFSYTINVVPGEGSSGSFVYSVPADCESLNSSLSATIGAPEPAITSYLWTLPDGQTLQDSTIEVQFNQPGDYIVSLQTTISNYQLTSVQLSSVGSGWGGDEDILGSPDPFITIADSAGNVVYTSAAVDNTNSASWTAINLALTNPPYVLSVYDDDPISPDDFLGSQNMQLNLGMNSFSSSGNIGSYQIGLTTVTELQDSVTLHVFQAPAIVISQNGTSVSAVPSDLVSYSWYLNGVLLPQSTGATIANAQPGTYTCVGTSVEGCEGSSNEILVCPSINISFDAVQQVLNASGTWDNYQWYYNGVAITGATLSYLIDPLPGVYSVQGTTDLGCDFTSQPFTITSVNEITEAFKLQLFPNPVVDQVRFTWNGTQGMVRIYNTLGALVFEERCVAQSGLISIAVASLPAGVYTVKAQDANGGFIGNFVKQ
jgi:hypothetical protein